MMLNDPLHDENQRPQNHRAALSRLSKQLAMHDRAANAAEQHARRFPNLLAWGRHYLPAHFLRPPSRMHRWMAKRLDAMRQRRGVKLNVLGPRGGAKSTVGTLAFVLRAAVEGDEPYIWIVSDTRPQAIAHLANIRAELLDNARLAADYAAALSQPGTWKTNVVTLANGATIEAVSTGQRIRGKRNRQYRPTLIVCDDLQNDSHMESSIARDKSRRWFNGLLMKAGTKRTNVVNLATALHREALAMQLHNTPGWRSRLFQAIECWPDDMPLWNEWERIYADVAQPNRAALARAFYDERQSAMQAGCRLLWPAEEDLYTLMCMRIEGGHGAFEREKQNVPVNPEQCEWPEEYFNEPAWFERWPADLQLRTLALDPSKGADARHGDYSAYVMLGVDRTGIVYVEADLARRPTPQMVADGVEHCRRFQPDVFGVEVNQYQELLADDFIAEFSRQGLLSQSIHAIENRVNKLVRIRRLGPYLSSRRMRFKSGSPTTRMLIEQLREFPLASHDDGPDALEMAVRLASEWLARAHFDDGLGHSLANTI